MPKDVRTIPTYIWAPLRPGTPTPSKMAAITPTINTPRQPQPGVIVYLSPDEGMGQAFAGVASPMVEQSVVFPAPDGAAFLSGQSRRAAALRGAFVDPPDNPPRI